MSPKRAAAATQEKPVQHVQPVSASNLKPGHTENPFPQQPLLQMVHSTCLTIQTHYTASSTQCMRSLTASQYFTWQIGGDLQTLQYSNQHTTVCLG